jgi:hypothetical protein
LLVTISTQSMLFEDTVMLVLNFFGRTLTPWKPGGSDGVADENEEKAKKIAQQKLADGTKLKGVLWPGMDLFDSATPEMKRMRNQRKDTSVLEQMMATSTGVEPTEIVYHPNGQVSHSRDIFGPLSTENSPVSCYRHPLTIPTMLLISSQNQIQDPTPKKRKSRKTAALLDVSVNAPRIRAPRPRKNTASQTPLKCPSAALGNHGLPAHSFIQGSIPNPLANFGERYAPTSEEDVEFRMTIGGMTKKRAFGIFQDAPEVSPGWTESTLEDHRYMARLSLSRNILTLPLSRFDFSGDPKTGQPNSRRPSIYISPTPGAKQSTIHGFGKENGPSGFSPAVHHRQPMSTSASHIYPGQVFYDPILNPLYDPTFARSFPYVGQQTGYNEDLKPPPPRFHSTLHGQFRPIHPTPCRPEQPCYGADSSNNGQSMR